MTLTDREQVAAAVIIIWGAISIFHFVFSTYVAILVMYTVDRCQPGSDDQIARR